MWGDSESASKNTSDAIFKIPKEGLLIFSLACDLVLAGYNRGVSHQLIKHTIKILRGPLSISVASNSKLDLFSKSRFQLNVFTMF